MTVKQTTEISKGSLVAWFALAVSLVAGLISNQVTQTKMGAAIEANARAIQEFREVRTVQIDVLQLLSANEATHKSFDYRLTTLEDMSRHEE